MFGESSGYVLNYHILQINIFIFYEDTINFDDPIANCQNI